MHLRHFGNTSNAPTPRHTSKRANTALWAGLASLLLAAAPGAQAQHPLHSLPWLAAPGAALREAGKNVGMDAEMNTEAWRRAAAPAFLDVDGQSPEQPAVAPAEDSHPKRKQHIVTTPEEGAAYPYQWRGLIWQSIEFDVVELVFRSTSDNVLRDLTIHKPYWHDWLASMQQWNMRRWSDGDDFLVDDVGHPMQGAVSAYIAIQNGPKDARLQWGDDGYWKSRFKGFLWAVVFSTQQKVSPVGEAGIGNDGGFTYGNQCLYHCAQTGFPPGSKYTNNTGWTDLTITPTVGISWVLAEDFLDKHISSRLVAARPDALWPRLVRSGLSPARSFANMLRWQQPWYRDWEHSLPAGDRVQFFNSEDVLRARELARASISPYFDAPTIAVNTPRCFNCRQFAIGAGLQSITKIRGWLTFDADASYHPDASPLPSDRAGGTMTRAVFGLGASRNWSYWSAHIALRPGLIRFSRAYLWSPVPILLNTVPPRIGTLQADPASRVGPGVVDANGLPDEPKLGDINHFVWNLNVAADHRITRRFSIRAGINDDVVRYRTAKIDPPGIGAPPYLSWLSKQTFINRGGLGYTVGPVFSF